MHLNCLTQCSSSNLWLPNKSPPKQWLKTMMYFAHRYGGWLGLAGQFSFGVSHVTAGRGLWARKVQALSMEQALGASPSSLALPTWSLRRGLRVARVVNSSWSLGRASVPRGTSMAFLTRPVTPAALCPSRPSRWPAQAWGERHGCHILVEGWPENLWTCFRTATSPHRRGEITKKLPEVYSVFSFYSHHTLACLPSFLCWECIYTERK